jgi:hypothetical protein
MDGSETNAVSNATVKPTPRIILDANSKLLPITAIIQTYNNAVGLEQTLKSLVNEVDHILVLDGRFEMKTVHTPLGKKKEMFSTDNSSLVAKKYGAEWIPARDYKWQWDKMNRVPELVPDGTWTFFIDTDEVLITHVHNGLRQIAGWFNEHTDMLMMKIEEPYFSHPLTGGLGRHRYYARLIKIKQGMRWVDEANIVYPGRVSTYAGTVPNFCWIRHLRRDL